MRLACIIAALGLTLAGCATVRPQLDSALTNAETVLLAARTVVDQDVQAGLLDATTASKIGAWVTAGQAALLAAKDAAAAHDAVTEQERIADVLAAVLEVNNAVLAAIHAAAKP